MMIYWLGVIASFLLMRWLRHKSNDDSWGTFLTTVVMSFASWLIFGVLLLVLLIGYISEEAPKPPKWL